MDNIVAVMVLRARLMHDDEAYHYHNPQAISELKLFIETTLTTFLQGYYDKNEMNLQATLDISDADYDSWLTQTAKEIIYFTAAQPIFIKDCENTVFPGKDLEFDHHNQCYTKHILETEHIDPQLYQTNGIESGSLCYLKTDDKDRFLGLSGCIFPLVGLLKGISYLFVKMLEASSEEPNTYTKN